MAVSQSYQLTPENVRIAKVIAKETKQSYYTVADKLFFMKDDALRYASSKGIRLSDVKFSFFDDEYTSLDWTVDPTDSLQELYKQRAQQIRDNYDYVMLAYSGGADSTNVLQTFVANNIKLDEIVSFYPIKAVESSTSMYDPHKRSAKNISFEWVYTAKPIMKLMSNRGYKCTALDWTDHTQSVITSGHIGDCFRGGMAANQMSSGMYMLAEHARKHEASTGQRVAIIYAIDKPRLIFDTIKKMFGLRFDDFNNSFWFKSDSLGYTPNIELFYYAPDFPKLVQKQCFVTKEAILNLTKSNPRLLSMLYDKVGSTMVFKPHDDFFKLILYPKWDVTTYQAEKATTQLYGTDQAAFWYCRDSIVSTSNKLRFVSQVNELISGISDEFFDYRNGSKLKMKTIHTDTIWF